MAYITNTAPLAWPLAVFNGLGRAFQTVYMALAMNHTFDSRFQEIQKLNALSDEELAARGLTRDRIAHHVYRDLFVV